MTTPERQDALFREAVSAIDIGDVTMLERLLSEHPQLLHERLEAPGAWLRDRVGDTLEGFFQRPYLLWFVAEDPVRNGKLPGNIAQVARTIIRAAQREGVDSLQVQLDYALRLVAWSWIARKSELQIELIDALIDAGAAPADTITQDASGRAGSPVDPGDGALPGALGRRHAARAHGGRQGQAGRPGARRPQREGRGAHPVARARCRPERL
jgi:peptide-methionine (S)-S-oxide reductase